jgi:cytochrome P450
MKSILYHLMRTPSARNRLLEELDSALEDGSLSIPVRFSEAAKLPYLTAVCKEAMRIHPSIGMSMPRHVPEGGLEIADSFFPAGTRVGISPAVIHFDKTIFGEDAEDFVPERWLGEGAINMDRYMLHFGQGARSCIGKNVSLLSLPKEFAT